MHKEKLLLTIDQEKYLAWLLVEKMFREPKTKKEFAEFIGVTPGTLSNWESKKAFLERWRLGVRGTTESPERTQALLDALYIKGVAGDTKSAELYLKATGMMPNASTVNINNTTSVKDLSDAELASLIMELGASAKKKEKV